MTRIGDQSLSGSAPCPETLPSQTCRTPASLAGMRTGIQHTEETEHTDVALFWGLKVLCLTCTFPPPVEGDVLKSIGFIVYTMLIPK